VGGAVALVAIVAVLFVFLGSSPLIGEWEETTSASWRQRITLNSNGTGVMFSLNVDTLATQSETPLVWRTSNDFPGLLQLEFTDEDDNETYNWWLEYELSVNAVGIEMLELTNVGWGGSDTFRRVD